MIGTKDTKVREGAQGAVKKPSKDKMRKQAIAAACQYLDALGAGGFRDMPGGARVGYAKGVICRAAGVEVESFNRIGVERLRGLTANFNKLRRDMERLVDESMEILVND